MESRTLANLRAGARKRSDTRGQLLRHPETDVNDYINEGHRAYRSFITSLGFRFYLTSTSPLTLAGTEVAGETFRVVPFPPTAAQIRGIDVQFSFSPVLWTPLKPLSIIQRRDYQLFPLATSSALYKIWFLPEPTLLVLTTDDTKLIVTPPEGLAWIEMYAAVQLCIEDDDPESTMASLKAEMKEIEGRTLLTLPKVVSAGSRTPRRISGSQPWFYEPGYFHVAQVPEGGGTSPTVGTIQLWLNAGP